MCSLAGAASLLSTGLSVAGSVISYNEQKRNAYNQWLYNVQQEVQNERYRGELIKYQNAVYEQEIKYGFEVLDYMKGEFERQKSLLERSTENIQQNLFTQYGQLLLRQVQEGIATTLNMDDARRQARKMAAGGEAAAASRGIEGVSVDQIVGDVARQEGEALSVMGLNYQATMQQLNMEMQGVKATADQRIYDLPMNTYAPTGPIKPPAPVSPVTPAAPVPMPSGSALAVNIGSSLINGLQNYAKWSGQSLNSLKIL